MNINGNLKFLGLGQAENFRVENLSVDPVAPSLGQIWYNTTTGGYKGFDGTTTFPFATGGNAAELQSELDRTQAAIGVNADGTFAAFVGSTYLGSATTHKEAVSLLDVAIKSVADAIAAEITARTDADATEVAARVAADAAEVIARDAAIALEATARADADAAELAARVAADITTASTASDQLSTEVTARLAGDAALGVRVDDVQAELNASQASTGLEVDGSFVAPSSTTYLAAATSIKDSTVLLDAAITSEVATRVGQVAGLASGLANETQLRIDGDANLQTQLTAYIDSAVTNNTNADNAETVARIAADSALQSELDRTQATIGVDTDGNLIPITGTNYLNDVTTVFGGAFVLDTQVKLANDAIAAEITGRTDADTAFNTALQAEIVTRANNDDAQQQELNKTQAGAGLEATGDYAAPTGSNYLNSAISLKDADFKLDAAVKVVADATASGATAITANADAITAEVARATAAEGVNAAAIIAGDTTNADAIAAEVTRATDAEAALATSIAGLAAAQSGGYYLYTAAIAATTHVVTHAMGNQFANVTVVDAANQVVIPQSITFDDVNQLTVTFNTAITCKVVISGLKA